MINECVYCKSEKEYLFVQSCINYNFHAKFEVGSYECIYWQDQCHGSYIGAVRTKDTIYTFEKWCELTDNYPDWTINTIEDLSYLTEFLIKNEIT